MPQLSPASGTLIFLTVIFCLIILVVSAQETLPPKVSNKKGKSNFSTRMIF